MKRILILVVFLAAVVNGQQRSFPVSVTPLPPGATGSVTLSLEEYNRLMELAARKPKKSDAPPLPFVIARAAFNLQVADQAVGGSVDISGALLDQGSIKVPLTTGFTVLDARQGTNPLPLLQEGTTHAGMSFQYKSR